MMIAMISGSARILYHAIIIIAAEYAQTSAVITISGTMLMTALGMAKVLGRLLRLLRLLLMQAGQDPIRRHVRRLRSAAHIFTINIQTAHLTVRGIITTIVGR